jgi:hypothetical protein
MFRPEANELIDGYEATGAVARLVRFLGNGASVPIAHDTSIADPVSYGKLPPRSTDAVSATVSAGAAAPPPPLSFTMYAAAEKERAEQYLIPPLAYVDLQQRAADFAHAVVRVGPPRHAPMLAEPIAVGPLRRPEAPLVDWAALREREALDEERWCRASRGSSQASRLGDTAAAITTAYPLRRAPASPERTVHGPLRHVAAPAAQVNASLGAWQLDDPNAPPGAVGGWIDTSLASRIRESESRRFQDSPQVQAADARPLHRGDRGEPRQTAAAEQRAARQQQNVHDRYRHRGWSHVAVEPDRALPRY